MGITVENGVLTIQKNWPPHWDWWALLRLPFAGQDKNDEISLLWDGQTLHSTRQVTFDGPLALQSQVQPFGSDEHSFDLRFRLGTELYIPAFEKEAR